MHSHNTRTKKKYKRLVIGWLLGISIQNARPRTIIIINEDENVDKELSRIINRDN